MLTHVTRKTETFVIFTDNPRETNQLIFTSNYKTLVSTLEFHNGRHDVQEAVHWVKSVRIRNFSGLYFPAFGLNTERYGVSLRIQSKCRKIQTRKIPNTDIFYAVVMMYLEGFRNNHRCSINLLYAIPIILSVAIRIFSKSAGF